jgi:hypothetical protein
MFCFIHRVNQLYFLKVVFQVAMLFINISINSGQLCQVIFNEINAVDPTKPEKNEFIELIEVCAEKSQQELLLNNNIFNGVSKKSLQGYKILGISSHKENEYKINLIANLWNFALNEDGYFLLGGINVPNVNMNISNQNVKTFTKLTKGALSLTSFLQNGNQHPAMVALVYSPDGLPNLNLTVKTPFLKLSLFKHEIKSHLVDLIIYGRRTSISHCESFEDLYDGYNKERNYILHEYDIMEGWNKDTSLNRCSARTDAFSPETFKLGKPTPGSENDCSGVQYIIQQHLQEIINPVVSVEDTENMNECKEILPSNSFNSMEISTIETSIQTEMSANQFSYCDVLSFTIDDIKNDSTIDVAISRKRKMDEEITEKEWETTAYFDKNWIEQITSNQKSLLPISYLEKEDFQQWFEYLPDFSNMAASKYQCRLCHKYYDFFKLDKRYKPNVANPFLGSNYKKNQEVFQHHASSRGHTEIIKLLIQRNASELEDDFNKIQEKQNVEEKSYYQITARMIRTVFVETKVNIPFDSHKDIVLLQQQNSVDMGFHHANRKAATTMMEVISQKMHEILLTNLVKNSDIPISIIVDTSTDNSGKHYLIVLFQTAEEERPIVYFYKLVHLGMDETADGLCNSLIRSFQNENIDLYSYLKRNLIGFASDGASVMLGEHNGLIKKLERKLEKKLYGIHCMAHRLHLLLRKPFEKISQLHDFESTINSVYNFYSRSHKLKAHLRQTAYSMNVNITELSYIYKERWISSEYGAIKEFNKSWLVLHTDLEDISNDKKQFNPVTRSKANRILNKIRQREFVMNIQFLLDFLSSFSQYNLLLQKRAGLVIGAESIRIGMLNITEALKSKDGYNLVNFYYSLQCSNAQNRVCYIEDYISSDTVYWQNKKLTNSTSYLNEYREQFLNDITNQINSYFPEGELNSFQIFTPKMIPDDESKIEFYGVEELKLICNKFGYDYLTIFEDWKRVLKNIISRADFCQIGKSDPNYFWPYFLNKQVGWTEALKKMIRTVLVIPIGSADAERGFSIMNHILGKRRTRLTSEHLEDIMRIRINGPNELEEFPALRYAKEWVRLNKMRTDDKSNVKRVKLSLAEDDEYEKVYLAKSSLF